jgi:hypothetical protein
MKHRIAVGVFALLLVGGFAGLADAAPITYLYRGVGSGDIGAASFVDASFVITALADTNNIGSWCCSSLQNTHLSTTLQITGLGSFVITTPSHTWWSPGVLGLGKNLSSNWMTFIDSAFDSYDLATDFGPVSGPPYHVAQFQSVDTSGGTLRFTSIPTASFQAITGSTVPDAGSSLLLLGVGLAGLRAWRMRLQ